MCHDIPGKIGPFSGDYDKKRNRAPCGGRRIQIPKFTPGFIFYTERCIPCPIPILGHFFFTEGRDLVKIVRCTETVQGYKVIR
jgi:hypothetical protein